jgi:hypothetical protein
MSKGDTSKLIVTPLLTRGLLQIKRGRDFTKPRPQECTE